MFSLVAGRFLWNIFVQLVTIGTKRNAVGPHQTNWLEVNDDGCDNNVLFVWVMIPVLVHFVHVYPTPVSMCYKLHSLSGVAKSEVQSEDIAVFKVPDVLLQDQYLHMHDTVQESGCPNFRNVIFLCP